MLVLCIGLQKSGSSWFFNLVNDILIETGASDSRDVRNKFDLHRFVKYESCAVQELSDENIETLTTHPVSDFTFAIKTHAKPNRSVLEKIKKNRIQPLIIVRDPKDMVASVLDAGRILRARGVFERFGKVKSIDEGIAMVKNVTKTWNEWKGVDGINVTRYEDLLSEPTIQMEKITNSIGRSLSVSKLQEIYKRYLPENIEKTGHGHLHFNKGVVGRYKKEMTSEQTKVCNKIFTEYMKELNYK